MNKIFEIIESLIYIRGEDGLSSKNLKDALNDEMSLPEVRKELKNFQSFWNGESHGLEVVEFNDIFKFATKSEFNNFVSNLVTIEKKQRLSNASIETVGIIAYKQPITKSQINEIRGVSSEAVVNTLLVKGLIEEKGISETIGHPVLYGISDKFYDYFQISSLKELPRLSEFDESEGVDEDFDLFQSQREE